MKGISKHFPLGLLFIVGLANCDSPTDPFATPVYDVRPYVTSDVLRHVDGRGQFIFSDPAATRDGLMTSNEAQSVALAAMASISRANPIGGCDAFGLTCQSAKAYLIAAHGRPIDFSRIRTGPRPPFFAESHLIDPTEALPLWVQTQYGPHYIVPLFENDRQVASMVVAA